MEHESSDGPLSKEEYQLLAAFRYRLRRFLRFSEEAAGAVGLTPQQHQALLSVIGFPGRDRVTIGELAERLQIKHHSAVGLANRLEAQGLLTRETSAEFPRHVFVRLTTKGMGILDTLTRAHLRELAYIREELRSPQPQSREASSRHNE